MIIRKTGRPILRKDLEIGSLITIAPQGGNEFEKYMVINLSPNNKGLKITGLKIIKGVKHMKHAYHLYADNMVLLDNPRCISLNQILIVKARLASDIVDKVLQLEIENRKIARAKEKVKREKQKVSRAKRKAASHSIHGPKKTYSPGDGSNSAWGALKYASKGYIHVYRG